MSTESQQRFYLEYTLEGGYIDHWLIIGPQAIKVGKPEQFDQARRKLAIAEHYYQSESGIVEPPVDQESCQIDDTEFKWTYYGCREDHFVDCSTFCHTWHYLRAWAYSELFLPAALETTLILTSNGPADVWINGQHVHRQAHFHHQDPKSVAFQAALQEGTNEILVRFEEVAARECPYAMALQIADPDEDTAQKAAVRLPTIIEFIERRLDTERIFEYAYIDRPVYTKGNEINLYWQEGMERQINFMFTIQDERRRIYLEGATEPKPGDPVNIGHPARLWEGRYDAVVQPPPLEWWQYHMRYEKRMPLHVLDTEYSESPYGTLAKRRQEALENAAKRENNLFAEIAKFQLGSNGQAGKWDEINVDLILESIDGIDRRGDCSDFYLVGLLGAMYRYMQDEAFPQALKQPLEACVLGFKYWHDEPGVDAMCYTTENHSILFHTCEILAGQLYPDKTFSNAGQTGQWHREKGENLALEWLRTRGRTGFREWDSNCYFEEDLLALTHLLDLAQNVEVRELAAVLIDKLFFILAINSFKGVFGSTHGRTYAPLIQGGQLEATSGITRLMWGMGVWNHHIRGLVSLACSSYELPFIFADMATELPDELWSRERCTGTPEEWQASGSLGPEVNKVTYRTPDGMLCSAQDYHPGEKGYQQHIWQATMGPDAVVFVTHPPCTSEEGAHRPNFWHGNYILPRVAQWKDVLVAVHNVPEPDEAHRASEMGFTHAYFPAYAFDEYAIEGGWAFAKKGDGYLALTATQGIDLIRKGPTAYRELRSYGRQNSWLCHMGRAALDGDFEAFREKVLAMEVDLQPLAATCTSLRGERLSFGWQGPLTVNGEEQAISGFKHIENPYCTAEVGATEIEIRYEEYIFKLDFS
ncbi:MAG: hypothetical protein JXA89_13075 [Anaerolineae bacterium]|nr:hypothetical protein [Anaerolineae bacterium]